MVKRDNNPADITSRQSATGGVVPDRWHQPDSSSSGSGSAYAVDEDEARRSPGACAFSARIDKIRRNGNCARSKQTNNNQANPVAQVPFPCCRRAIALIDYRWGSIGSNETAITIPGGPRVIQYVGGPSKVLEGFLLFPG